MNSKFNNSVRTSSNISQRTTILTPGVEHTLSIWKSIPKTTESHNFFLSPKYPEAVHVRRFWCKGCSACKKFDFLSCVNSECGGWRCCRFELKVIVKSKQTVLCSANAVCSTKRKRSKKNVAPKLKKRKKKIVS